MPPSRRFCLRGLTLTAFVFLSTPYAVPLLAAAPPAPPSDLMEQLHLSDEELYQQYNRTLKESLRQKHDFIKESHALWSENRDQVCGLSAQKTWKSWISILMNDDQKLQCKIRQNKKRTAYLLNFCQQNSQQPRRCQHPSPVNDANLRSNPAAKETTPCVPAEGVACAPIEKTRTCGFPDGTLPKDYALFAAGNYNGYRLNFQIDQSGSEATQMDLRIHYPEKPVVLILGAYDPTIWNLHWTSGTTIAALYITGYHTQVVAGVSDATPTLISTHENKHACGYLYVSQDNLPKINPLAQRVFGRNVDRVFLSDHGKVDVGSPIPPGAALTNAPDRTPDSHRLKNTPLSGRAGLIEAVNKGELRPATQEDQNEWVQLMLKKQNSNPLLPPVEGAKPPSISFHNAYVVLKAFKIPAGLYGGHLATFLVPKGVPMPTGDPGHSTIYDFNTESCTGPICRNK